MTGRRRLAILPCASQESGIVNRAPSATSRPPALPALAVLGKLSPRSTTLALVTLGYLAWALVLIWGSSVPVKGEHRYFCLFDDAMISMRYAWNLAHGKGCCWNPGEYVQGFTSPLMVGLMALPCLVLSKSTACLVVQLFGIPTVLGVAWYARRLCQMVCGQRWLPELAFTAVLTYYPLSYWSLMGMETGVLCLCMLVAVYFALRQDAAKSTVAMCLAFLARPDFLVVAALLLAYLFMADRRRALASAGVVAGFVALVLLAQYLYYGDPLPNPYTLKIVGFPLLARIRRGAGFVTPFLAGALPVLAFAMAGVGAAATRARYLFLVIACALVGYQISVGGDAWPYWRMVTPMVPIALVLAVVGAHAVLRGRGVATTAAILLCMLLADAQFVPEMAFAVVPYKVDENAYNLNLALVLNRSLRPGAAIGVEWAGVLPYYTDFRAIDFLGKTDRNIARLKPDSAALATWSEAQSSLPGHSKYDLDYSIGELKPDYIQTYHYGHSDTSPWIQRDYEYRVVDGLGLIVRKGSLR